MLTGVTGLLHIFKHKKKKKKKRNGSLPVVVLWRLDFIQASGSGIISMQMFFTVNSRSDLRGESEDESGESEECFPEVEKRTEIFFYPGGGGGGGGGGGSAAFKF